jgi:hypothetical protein
MRSVFWALVIALAFFGLALTLPACGGPEPSGSMAPSTTTGQRNADGLLLFAQPCAANEECESGLCTKFSYDRKPGPLCTYACDTTGATPPPEACVHGCNKKGYCRIP